MIHVCEGRIKGTTFKVIVENEDQVEVSFTRMWDASLEGKLVPLNIDKRLVKPTLNNIVKMVALDMKNLYLLSILLCMCDF